jgi:hypothetical protein
MFARMLFHSSIKHIIPTIATPAIGKTRKLFTRARFGNGYRSSFRRQSNVEPGDAYDHRNGGPVVF